MQHPWRELVPAAADELPWVEALPVLPRALRRSSDIDDLYGIEWAYIPHFYYNFYVYQYATSLVASTSLFNQIKKEMAKGDTTTRDAYVGLLSAGSSKYPIDLLRDTGVDMTTSAPFKAAMEEMNRVMDEIEKILDGKK